MASKYAGLKGKVPQEQTPREANILRGMETRMRMSFAELATEHNTLKTRQAKLADYAKRLKQQIDAIELLMQDRLNAENHDRITTTGFNWSISYEPYASAENPEEIVKYFREHNMEAQLELSKTELASRLKTFVKEEALNNELTIEEVEEVNPQTGETFKKIVAKSKIPGVKVFLASEISKTKAKA